ncbi:hypothetical protein THRCLA_21401 [Thraustotheca clavata]|uniref:tRNA pseudouridine synthase n=1 Tax=Thraustotheca clavata TaxID=74557 RepID=A0A1V9ZX11_9STRA|nr:hypothetical protein THRCLA_21401 [Thraustotheca clavata]
MAGRQRYLLTIEYIGTAFHGFQAQPEAAVRTVQVELEKALLRLVGSQENLSRVIVSSRTDAGVHAIANTAHVDVLRTSKGKNASKFPPQIVRNAMNSFLRQSEQPIVVRDVVLVRDTFHSRFDAIGREYVYKIQMPKKVQINAETGLLPSALFTRDFAWHVDRPLDYTAMKEACHYLRGEHDFSSFRGSKCQANSPIRELTTLDIESIALNNADELCESDAMNVLHVKAAGPSFLYHMVRNIVGALVHVGTHKLEPKDIQRILAARDRTVAPAMAPAHGLYLRRVLYPPQSINSS